MATTSAWTGYSEALTSTDPAGSSWTGYVEASTPAGPEWYVASATGWKTAKMVAFS